MEYEVMTRAIGRLNSADRNVMADAAAVPLHGGGPVGVSVYPKAVDNGLVFRSSGRLKPLAYEVLRA